MEHTVVLVKPDGVKRGLVGEIINRFEKAELKIVAMKMVWIDGEMVRKHYPTTRKEWVQKIGEKTLEAYQTYGKDVKEHLGTLEPEEIGKMVCDWLVDYLTSGPVVAMVIEEITQCLLSERFVVILTPIPPYQGLFAETIRSTRQIWLMNKNVQVKT
jgi:nucleoside-diphosphate kinase